MTSKRGRPPGNTTNGCWEAPNATLDAGRRTWLADLELSGKPRYPRHASVQTIHHQPSSPAAPGREDPWGALQGAAFPALGLGNSGAREAQKGYCRLVSWAKKPCLLTTAGAGLSARSRRKGEDSSHERDAIGSRPSMRDATRPSGGMLSPACALGCVQELQLVMPELQRVGPKLRRFRTTET